MTRGSTVSQKLTCFVEGQDDKAVINGLLERGILKGHLEVVEVRGKDNLLPKAMDLVSPRGGAGKSAILLRDYDDLNDLEDVGGWFERGAANEIRALGGEPEISRIRAGNTWKITIKVADSKSTFVGIPVGRRHDDDFRKRYEVARHAVDDYLLDLMLEKRFYTYQMTRLNAVPHATAIEKMKEVPQLLRKNGLAVDQSKRLTMLFRGITGYMASPATFIDDLFGAISKTSLSQDDLRPYFEPLLSDIEMALAVLLPKADQPAG